MRSIAALLLILCSASSLRASTDRVHPAQAVRTLPRRLLVVAIARPDHSAPASPSRREQAVEPAFDEEESSDLDPLGAPPQAVAPDRFASPRPELSSASSPPPSSTRPRRPGLLRC